VQTSYGQWLAPDGTPSGESFRVASRASVRRVAVAPGRWAIAVVYDWVGDTPYRVVALQGERVIRRGSLPEPDCSYVVAVTATERGWFVACERWAFPEPMRRPGLWLDPAGRVRHEVEIGPGDELAVAGGIRNQVALVYTDPAGSPLLARWITPRRSGPVVVVDPSTDGGLFVPSVTHLRDRVFAVSWLAEWASGTDGEDSWRSTTVQEATFRAPDVVRGERRFSPPSAGIHPGPISEHKEPFVLRTGDREQLVGWFGCGYGSSPGGRVCYGRDGLYLRARRNAGPSGQVIGLSFVSPFARVVHTGDLLLTITLFQETLDEDLWSLQIQGWEIQ
jgi:hypothetical protein